MLWLSGGVGGRVGGRGVGDSGIGGEVRQRRERRITSAESGISGQIIATLCFSDRQAAQRLCVNAWELGEEISGGVGEGPRIKRASTSPCLEASFTPTSASQSKNATIRVRRWQVKLD